LQYLTKGFKKNKCGYHRLLLGRKGVGKTRLLRELQNEAKNFFGDNLITIYQEYSDVDQKLTPFNKLLDALGLNISTTQDINSFEKILKELKTKNKYAFLCLDEIQNLYLPCTNGKSIIGQISQIGCSTEGRIFCIITGSSYHLRQLCFNKLASTDKETYPNYTGIDLNSTKYTAKWIYPFLESIDFEKTLTLLNNTYEKKDDQNDESQKVRMYLCTGGNPRLMEKFIDEGECDSYSISLKHFDGSPNKEKYDIILDAIFKATNSLIEQDSYSTSVLPENISDIESWTRLIRSDIIEKEVRKQMDCDLTALFFNLSDMGQIRFLKNSYERHFLEPVMNFVSLGSPYIYLELLAKGITTLSLIEIFSLKHPSGTYAKIAEDVTLRFLAINSKKFVDFEEAHFETIDANVQNFVLKHDYTIAPKSKHANLDSNEITNRLFKECYDNVKDVFGMDGLLLKIDKESSENGLIAHRFQIKLGKSNINFHEAQKIIEKVSSQKMNFENCFTAANKRITKHYNYLITTRGVESNAKDHFESNNWKVFGKSELILNLWPSETKKLGHPFQ
jgi:hypothetical protein